MIMSMYEGYEGRERILKLIANPPSTEAREADKIAFVRDAYREIKGLQASLGRIILDPDTESEWLEMFSNG